MKLSNLTLYIVFFIYYSCSEKVEENEIFNKIETFSGLKIEKEQVDSITYKHDYSFVDDVTLYILFINENQVSEIEKKLIELPHFTNYNDSLISYSVLKDGEIEQLNFIPQKKTLSYSIAHL